MIDLLNSNAFEYLLAILCLTAIFSVGVRIKIAGMYHNEFLLGVAASLLLLGMNYLALAIDIKGFADNSELRVTFIRPPLLGLLVSLTLYILNGYLYEFFRWIHQLLHSSSRLS